MRIKARAKLACQIAGLEPARLQEAVHFGHLPCAPETRPGQVRIFDVDQIVMLTIYARLVRDGLTNSKAGQAACAIYQAIVDYDVAETAIGARYFFPPLAREGVAEDHRETVILYDAGGTNISYDAGDFYGNDRRRFSPDSFFIDCPVAAIRSRVQHALGLADVVVAERILGEDLDA